jgi:hypothetical protein
MVPGALLILSLLGPATLAAQDPDAQDPDAFPDAFVELLAEPRTPYVGQLVHLRVRFGVTRELARTDLVQLFPRALDLPVQVRVPGLDSLSGARLLTPQGVTDGGSLFVWEQTPTLGAALEDHRRGGVEFEALQVERTLVPNRPGELALPAPLMVYAVGKGYREDVLNGRVATDREDRRVDGPALSLRVQPLPERGRPPEFSGAVGTFEVWTRLDQRRPRMGETCSLTLELEGDGNPAQALDRWPARVEGFALLGRTVEPDGRRARLELRPKDPGLEEVPALAFVYFDPGTGQYATALSEPIPIQVRAPVAEIDPPVSRAPTGPLELESGRLRIVLLAVSGLIAVLLLWLLVSVAGRYSSGSS